MNSRDLALAAIVEFVALPIVVCLLRAFGPRWFGVWSAIAAATAAAWLYAGAAYFHHENNLDYLRAHRENSALEFPRPNFIIRFMPPLVA